MSLEERAARRSARARAVRRRRIVALAVACSTLVVAGIAFAETRDGARAASANEPSQVAQCIAQIKGAPPSWLTSQRATVLVDSVLLGGVPSVRSNLRGWDVEVAGRAAVMIGALEEELRETDTPIAPLAIVGVGYNSLWERGRKNYRNWAREFDRHANDLVRTLRRQGAEQIVWVTLRDARRRVIPSDSLWQYDKYAWYFPYVNERLRLLDKRSPYVILADWARVSDRPGLTYDAIHLDPDGQALMARTIRQAFGREAERQVAVARSAAVTACKRNAD
jgi:hypothetical protein